MSGLPSLRSERSLLVAVLALSVLLRLLPVVFHDMHHDRILTPDSVGYLQLEASLATGRGFVRGADGAPEVFRTPGYPLFLAALSLLPGRVTAWAVVVQIALGVLVVALTYCLARPLLGGATAIVAAVLIGVDLEHIVYTNMVMADIPCVAAVAGAFALGCSTRRSSGLWRPASAGVCLSLAVAVRPISGLLWVPLATLLRFRNARGSQIALLVVASLIFPAAWTVRNGVETGEWTISTAFDTNLYLVVAPKILARSEHVSVDRARTEAHRRLERLQRRNPSLPIHRAERVLALQLIRAHPRAALTEAAVSAGELLLAGERRNLLRLIGLPGGADRKPSLGETARSPSTILRNMMRIPPFEAGLVVYQLLFNSILWACAGVGACWAWRSGHRLELLTALLALAVVLVPAGVVATARQRIPVSFLAATIAAAGVTRLRHR